MIPHETALEECVTEFNRCADRLAERHEASTVMLALAIHVGVSLRVFREAGTYSEDQVRAVLRRIAVDAGV